MTPAAFRSYVQALRANLAQGNATEHTHRPALETLLEIDAGISAVNEPKRIDCGAPDFAIVKAGDNPLTIGYIEAKDIGASLEAIEMDSARANPDTDNGRQLKRYRDALANLILTNYAEFRWYVDGELQGLATLACPDSNGHLAIADAGINETGVLLGNFISRSPESVGDSAELARRMARLTRIIRDVVQAGFNQDAVSQDVKDLYQASREHLVPDLSTDGFADMFAQTLAYGLFAARVNHSGGPFRRQMAAHYIPPTNPFIRDIFAMVAGPSLDSEPFVSFVDDLAQLLVNSDMSAVLADFGKRSVRQDPIMNFYETFLAAYDSALRERRGVYYTPEPVISYIVRSVDYLLREKFGCADGLADYSNTEYDSLDNDGNPTQKESHRVLVLDPACGTGSFLYAVVDHVREHYRNANLGGMWSGYVSEHLLPRLFGFELLMAPYAMAHLKLGLQLAAQDMPEEDRHGWAYQFDEDERLSVYLTNSLEQSTLQAALPGPYRTITDEANAATEVKRDLPIMVVLGNPPYSGHSANKGAWIGELIDDYKQVDGQPLGERNTKWLQDDYVKFIRFGQWRIQQSGSGILAFITNHAYLNNPTFRGMRQQLLDTFTDIYLLDLHGNSRTRERATDGGVDENVFDIQQGVTIALFAKEAGKPGPAKVRHSDLWGTRDAKYAILSTSDLLTTDWQTVEPESPDYRFKPWDKELEGEYRQWPTITEIIPVNSVGIVTGQDRVAIRWSSDEMSRAAHDFPFPANESMDDNLVVPILYRPLDIRYTYYSNSFITRRRQNVMRHILAGENLGLIFMRQVAVDDEYSHFGVYDGIVDNRAFYSSKGITQFCPLYIYPTEQEITAGLYAAGDREPNLAADFTDDLARRTGLRFVPDGPGDLQDNFGPEDLFQYIYAVFHSPAYRERYDQFLRADFPRVPFPHDAAQFRALAGLGQRLTEIHLLRSASLSASSVSFPVSGDDTIARGYPKYTAPNSEGGIAKGRVNINRRQYFEGIPPEVWQFRIGGYQPMDKWLKDRRGRALSFDDIDHYRRMAAAIGETMSLMAQVDEAIVNTGGLFTSEVGSDFSADDIPYSERQRRAHAIYDAEIRASLTSDDKDKYVLIDIVSGDYEMGENEAALTRLLRERRPEAVMHCIHHHQSRSGHILGPRRFRPVNESD